MAKKKFLFSWTKFFANELISATVLQADKEVIQLLFKNTRNLSVLTSAVAGEFTSTGTVRTCSMVTIVANQGGTGYHLMALTMSSAYALNNPITLVFNPTKKGKTVTVTVTNSISS